jgi:hypothetical protein
MSPDERPTGDGSPTGRRALLRLGGVLAASALAGCGGDDPSNTTTDGTDGPSTGPTTTDVPTDTATPGGATGRVATAERFVERLAAGEYEAATEPFAPSLAAQVDAATLETVWSDLQRQFGAFVSVEGATPTTTGGFAAVVVETRFSGGRRGLRVVFDEADRIAGFQVVAVDEDASWSPPDYVDPGAFEARAVDLDGPGSCALPGELAVPVDAGAGDAGGVPGVVVLGGSGPTDLDGSVGPNRPYRDLAYGLASEGVASLRFTKRTAVCPVDPATLTIDNEYTDDALAALERLRETTGVDPDRVAVVGHSLGALLAPRVAARADEVTGVAMLAPPGRPLHRLLLAQTRYLADLDGRVTEAERERIAAVETAVERIDALELDAGETVLGAGRPYWASLEEYDPYGTARSLSVPILLARGERDYQTTSADLDRWREALADESGVVVVETYAGLNHLFAPGEGPASPAEYETLGHVAPRVVADLAGWVEGL